MCFIRTTIIFMLIVLSKSDPFYTKCSNGSGYYCFGFPRHCLANEDCHVLLTGIPLNDAKQTVEFELIGRLTSKNRWFAAALSDDKIMGDDSVTECLVLRDDETLLMVC